MNGPHASGEVGIKSNGDLVRVAVYLACPGFRSLWHMMSPEMGLWPGSRKIVVSANSRRRVSTSALLNAFVGSTNQLRVGVWHRPPFSDVVGRIGLAWSAVATGSCKRPFRLAGT